MKLAYIQTFAESLCVEMQPYCTRIEIAGSIRRQCADCKDIEIVCIPRFEEREAPGTLFEKSIERVNLLREWAANEAPLSWEKRGEKYWCGHWEAHGISVDIFMPSVENWGYIFMLRTGSAEFMKEVVTHARRVGHHFDKGRLHLSGIPVETREETDVFNALGLAYVKPENRNSARSLKIAACQKSQKEATRAD